MSEQEPIAQALREVLLDPGDVHDLDLPGQVPAGVLVPLYLPDGALPDSAPDGAVSQLRVVLTKRRSDLRRHAGEISFPGGRQDPGDRDLAVTALREATEEIGLQPAAVRIVGALQPTSTFATNYAIHPFVALMTPGQEWRLSPHEVESVIELSLRDIRAGYTRTGMERRGISFRTDAYIVGDHLIWGATARVLGDLLERIEPLMG